MREYNCGHKQVNTPISGRGIVRWRVADSFAPGAPDVDFTSGSFFSCQNRPQLIQSVGERPTASPEEFGCRIRRFCVCGFRVTIAHQLSLAAESSRPGEKILASACPGRI